MLPNPHAYAVRDQWLGASYLEPAPMPTKLGTWTKYLRGLLLIEWRIAYVAVTHDFGLYVLSIFYDRPAQVHQGSGLINPIFGYR